MSGSAVIPLTLATEKQHVPPRSLRRHHPGGAQEAPQVTIGAKTEVHKIKIIGGFEYTCRIIQFSTGMLGHPKTLPQSVLHKPGPYLSSLFTAWNYRSVQRRFVVNTMFRNRRPFSHVTLSFHTCTASRHRRPCFNVHARQHPDSKNRASRLGGERSIHAYAGLRNFRICH